MIIGQTALIPVVVECIFRSFFSLTSSAMFGIKLMSTVDIDIATDVDGQVELG